MNVTWIDVATVGMVAIALVGTWTGVDKVGRVDEHGLVETLGCLEIGFATHAVT